MRPPARSVLLALVAALALTGGLVGLGTVIGSDEEEPPSAEAEPFRTTALADFDTSGLAVRRASFCDSIDPRQVEAALGAPPESERAWDNGDRIELPSGTRDVVHEYGCEFAAGELTARAWVFAPPVDVRRASRLVENAGPAAPSPCADLDPAYGEPSVGFDCLGGDSETAFFRGLFGDAWLSCELSTTGSHVTGPDLADRAGRWCVGVALAASGS